MNERTYECVTGWVWTGVGARVHFAGSEGDERGAHAGAAAQPLGQLRVAG